MEKKSVSVGGLKKGDTILIDDAPCKITDTATSRPGKHGHAKVNLTAVGILDGKKRQLVMPGHDKVEAPIIEKKSAQILSVTGNSANVMDMETYETFDMEIPEDMKEDVKEGKEVLYWTIMGAKVMKQVKNN
ncbi:MAG TPA: translation initiation factor IF-5A [Candidatus Nanoarchaeia archaeon]|nr:translation initiation factor IF-5A [Candidatus Nanoarchaeia archaeon]